MAESGVLRSPLPTERLCQTGLVALSHYFIYQKFMICCCCADRTLQNASDDRLEFGQYYGQYYDYGCPKQ